MRKYWRTSAKIAKAALYLLNEMNYPIKVGFEALLYLANDNTGPRTPVHDNHLGDVSLMNAFTTKRPDPLKSTYFDDLNTK